MMQSETVIVSVLPEPVLPAASTAVADQVTRPAGNGPIEANQSPSSTIAWLPGFPLASVQCTVTATTPTLSVALTRTDDVVGSGQNWALIRGVALCATICGRVVSPGGG